MADSDYDYVCFDQVEKVYDNAKTVVKQFSLSIKRGEFVSLLGPSGCGKTTTLRMLAGLDSVSSGKISLDGEFVNDPARDLFVPPENRKLGMVFQSYAVWPHMTVFDNVAYPLKISGVSRDEISQRVKEVLETVELAGLEHRKPQQLSGGQQQRVALARGLVARPKVLLLDEPLSNLDAKLREKMRKDIRNIQQKLGLTALYVTHDQVEANTMSDRICIMKDGLIQQVGSPSEVHARPVNDFVKEFLNA